MPDQNANVNLLGFQQGGCRGFCPVYTLQFYSNGRFTYQGLRNVDPLGQLEKQLDPAELDRLNRLLKAVNLWQYPENIQSQVADAPGSTMTVYDDAKSHSVSGSIDRPKPILDLETLIKDLAEAHGLSVRKGVDPNALADSAPEIIISLKESANAGNWVAAYSKQKLTLIRRLSAENTWLAKYDPALNLDDILRLLKKSEDVLDVQENQKSNDRH